MRRCFDSPPCPPSPDGEGCGASTRRRRRALRWFCIIGDDHVLALCLPCTRPDTSLYTYNVLKRETREFILLSSSSILLVYKCLPASNAVCSSPARPCSAQLSSFHKATGRPRTWTCGRCIVPAYCFPCDTWRAVGSCAGRAPPPRARLARHSAVNIAATAVATARAAVHGRRAPRPRRPADGSGILRARLRRPWAGLRLRGLERLAGDRARKRGEGSAGSRIAPRRLRRQRRRRRWRWWRWW